MRDEVRRFRERHSRDRQCKLSPMLTLSITCVLLILLSHMFFGCV